MDFNTTAHGVLHFCLFFWWSSLAACDSQGSQNRWEPVQFDRLPVKPVWAGSGLGRYQTGSNSKFEFEFKKNEKFSKNF